MKRFVFTVIFVIFISLLLLTGFTVYYNNSGSKQSSPVVTTGPNQIYAGYLVSELPFPGVPVEEKKQYSSVFGSWKVPEIKKNGSKETSYSAAWIGLGGINGSLEQIATVICCENGNPVYEARYQVFDKNNKTKEGSQLITDSQGRARTVKASDNITAGVIHLYVGKYLLAMLNTTQRWLFLKVVNGSNDGSGTDASEWIVESPVTGTNVNFLTATTPVTFTNCFSGLTPINKCSAINKMVSMSGNTIKASPGTLSSGGSAFTVKWENQGKIEAFDPYVYQLRN